MFLSPCAFSLKCAPVPTRGGIAEMSSRQRVVYGSSSRTPSPSSPTGDCGGGSDDGNIISLREWQGWGTSSQVPRMVIEAVEYLKALERDTESQMSFGGLGGKLQGSFKAKEDKKHRAMYQSLVDSEKKIQFFAARQIACRLLGSRGYLCQKCWLPLEDCMCSQIMPRALWHGIHFWLYMHPKDFLRQNNTGKLLWQIFGVQAATLCLFGIAEQEDIMWNAFRIAGKNAVWFLYPNQNNSIKSVQERFLNWSQAGLEGQLPMTDGDVTLNLVLIDGTWNNSAAMFRRLKEQAKSVWGTDELPCISLTMGVSTMHKLRPQPSWDRTCTAAAAINLLYELHLLPGFSSHELDKQAGALEDALGILLDALTNRRLRMGRSISRKERYNSNIC